MATRLRANLRHTVGYSFVGVAPLVPQRTKRGVVICLSLSAASISKLMVAPARQSPLTVFGVKQRMNSSITILGRCRGMPPRLVRNHSGVTALIMVWGNGSGCGRNAPCQVPSAHSRVVVVHP